MPYRVRFFRNGEKIGEAHWDKPLHQIRLSASNVLVTHKADKAEILDIDEGDKLVETVTP